MQIKQLIQKLQNLYDEYDDSYKIVMGEPEIMIDVFEVDLELPHSFKYKGFSPNVVIDKSDDGVYDILSTFNQPKVDNVQDTSPWPFPKSSNHHPVKK